MSLATLLSEIWIYAQTKEYREGLFVEASGLILDVLLLIVGVKIIYYYLGRQSRSTTNFASSFFIVQFLREVLSLQLRSGGVSQISTCLKDAFEERRIDSLFSHSLYGNTENLLDLLRIRMQSGEHMAGHRTLTSEHRKDLAKEAQAVLGRLDNLLVMLASLRQEEQCLRAYEIRVVLTSVSGYLEDLSKSSDDPPPRTFAPMSSVLSVSLERWFKSCKKVLDRQLNTKVRWAFVSILLSMPWVALYRFLVRRWCRFRDQPYVDPYSSNFPQLFCVSLEKALGTKWSEVVSVSGIKEKDLRLLLTQHVALPQDAQIALLEKMRLVVPVALWNGLLAASLISDVESRPKSVVTVEAEKANALSYLVRLARKDENSNQVIEYAFQSIWNLRPTSE